jgi:hypothetical protein
MTMPPAPEKLPALPETDGEFCASVRGQLGAYSADSMRAYALQAIAEAAPLAEGRDGLGAQLWRAIDEAKDPADFLARAIVILQNPATPADQLVEPFTCRFCGAPSWVDPSDQTMPPDYCHPSDHGEQPDDTCGGCGNADPNRRCIGCLHQFTAQRVASCDFDAFMAEQPRDVQTAVDARFQELQAAQRGAAGDVSRQDHELALLTIEQLRTRLRNCEAALEERDAQILAASPPRGAECAECGGRGFTDDGHEDDYGRVWSAPVGCDVCNGQGTAPTHPAAQADARDAARLDYMVNRGASIDYYYQPGAGTIYRVVAFGSILTDWLPSYREAIDAALAAPVAVGGG